MQVLNIHATEKYTKCAKKQVGIDGALRRNTGHSK